MAEKKNYYIRVYGRPVPVTEAVYLSYYRMNRRARFLAEKDAQHHTTHYSALDTEETLGEEAIFDPAAPSVEDLAIYEVLKEQLYQSLEQLPEEDRALIQALYFEQLGERTYAERLGISQKGVNKRRQKVLEKLRKLMKV